MGFFGIFKSIGRWIAAIFKGRAGEVIEKLTPVAEKIVRDLMTGDLPGPARFEEARRRLIEEAVAEGIEWAEHALNLLIELEVTKAKGDAIEQILDEGLELAREVVNSVDTGFLAGDSERRERAVNWLKMKLLKEGKQWLTSTHLLNLLIEAAVASFKN